MNMVSALPCSSSTLAFMAALYSCPSGRCGRPRCRVRISKVPWPVGLGSPRWALREIGGLRLFEVAPPIDGRGSACPSRSRRRRNRQVGRGMVDIDRAAKPMGSMDRALRLWLCAPGRRSTSAAAWPHRANFCAFTAFSHRSPRTTKATTSPSLRRPARSDAARGIHAKLRGELGRLCARSGGYFGQRFRGAGRGAAGATVAASLDWRRNHRRWRRRWHLAGVARTWNSWEVCRRCCRCLPARHEISGRCA